MNEPMQPLPQLEIGTPCPKSWDEMSGDEQARFCGHCKKTVFNFAAMSTNDIQQVLASRDSVCARIRRDAGGEVLTNDSPPCDLPSRRDWLSQLASLAAMLLAMVSLTGCRGETRSSDPVLPPNSTTEQPMMGEVCIPEAEMGDVLVVPPEHELGRIKTSPPSDERDKQR